MRRLSLELDTGVRSAAVQSVNSVGLVSLCTLRGWPGGVVLRQCFVEPLGFCGTPGAGEEEAGSTRAALCASV